MIRPLRQRHRIIVSLLTVLLPLAFVFGLSARKVPTRSREVSPLLRNEESVSLPQVLFEKENLWPEQKITTRLLADAFPPARIAIELHPQEELAAPDILVYWSAQNTTSATAPLDEAYLLGTLAGNQKRRWLLPEAALHSEGKLVLYSLGHQTVLASALLKIPQGAQQ